MKIRNIIALFFCLATFNYITTYHLHRENKNLSKKQTCKNFTKTNNYIYIRTNSEKVSETNSLPIKNNTNAFIIPGVCLSVVTVMTITISFIMFFAVRFILKTQCPLCKSTFVRKFNGVLSEKIEKEIVDTHYMKSSSSLTTKWFYPEKMSLSDYEKTKTNISPSASNDVPNLVNEQIVYSSLYKKEISIKSIKWCWRKIVIIRECENKECICFQNSKIIHISSESFTEWELINIAFRGDRDFNLAIVNDSSINSDFLKTLPLKSKLDWIDDRTSIKFRCMNNNYKNELNKILYPDYTPLTVNRRYSKYGCLSNGNSSIVEPSNLSLDNKDNEKPKEASPNLLNSKQKRKSSPNCDTSNLDFLDKKIAAPKSTKKIRFTEYRNPWFKSCYDNSEKSKEYSKNEQSISSKNTICEEVEQTLIHSSSFDSYAGNDFEFHFNSDLNFYPEENALLPTSDIIGLMQEWFGNDLTDSKNNVDDEVELLQVPIIRCVQDTSSIGCVNDGAPNIICGNSDTERNDRKSPFR